MYKVRVQVVLSFESTECLPTVPEIRQALSEAIKANSDRILSHLANDGGVIPEGFEVKEI